MRALVVVRVAILELSLLQLFCMALVIKQQYNKNVFNNNNTLGIMSKAFKDKYIEEIRFKQK